MKPRVMALAGTLDEARHAALVAERAGATLAGLLMVSPELAASPLDQAVDGWLVACADPALASPLDVLLDTLNDRARSAGTAVVVWTAPDTLDAAWARLPERSAVLLCEPSAADEVAAVACALVRADERPGMMVAEDGSGRGANRLRKLSEDVDRIARVLAALTAEQEERIDRVEGGGDPEAPPVADDALLSLIRATVRARRQRANFFPGDLFADPAWDMLLDLMAARIERKRVAVSSLCIAAAVPATTALRYLKTMTGAGLFVRRPDATDGRRVFIELSDAAAEQMGRYLGRLRDIIAPALA